MYQIFKVLVSTEDCRPYLYLLWHVSIESLQTDPGCIQIYIWSGSTVNKANIYMVRVNCKLSKCIYGQGQL